MATLTKPNGGAKPVAASPLTDFPYEPFAVLTSMRRFMDSFFDAMFVPQAMLALPLQAQPQANVYEKDGAYTIECGVPGYKKDDISVEAKGNEVTISGRYSEDKTEAHKQYRRREMRQGSFSRTITFPENVDPEKVVASLENGLLKVTVQPVRPIERKKIPITTV
jgi:HSP20 family protein